MRSLPSSEKVEFLLDENVSHSLKNLINSKGSKAITLQELNKRGIKNSILLKLARKLDKILITYDKDFLNMKHKPEDKIILIDIHPLIDEKVVPSFQKFLNILKIKDLEENIIILYEKMFKLRTKN
jgi:predicted nuclease of predicted toxin-antitoxin system